jgi:5-methylcytosine-specific restriction endonuclease McrA
MSGLAMRKTSRAMSVVAPAFVSGAMRSEFSTKTQTAALKRSDGRCEGCGCLLVPAFTNYDHDKPCGLGGDNSLENCRVLCKTCHNLKTHKSDLPRMRKADRQRKKAFGIRKAKRRIPGRKFNGMPSR